MTVEQAHVVSPGEVWSSWGGEAPVVALLVAAACAYALAARAARPPRRAAACGCAGFAVLGLALASPLHAAAGALFSAHMVQHMALVAVAAPLLALGCPPALARALPPSLRRRASRALRRPAWRAVRGLALNATVVVGAHVAVLWLWHLPGPYEAAARRDVVHALEHASLLATAVLFWRVVLHVRAGPSYGVAFAALFATMLSTGALGAVLAFSSQSLYAVHEAGARAWHTTPLADQQLAGAVMWVPAGAAYLGGAVLLLLRLLRALERTAPATPVREDPS